MYSLKIFTHWGTESFHGFLTLSGPDLPIPELHTFILLNISHKGPSKIYDNMFLPLFNQLGTFVDIFIN